MKLNREPKRSLLVRSNEALRKEEDPIELLFDPKQEVTSAELDWLKKQCQGSDYTTNGRVAVWAELRQAFGKEVFPPHLLGRNLSGRIDQVLHTPGDELQPILFFLKQLEEKIEPKTFAKACRYQLDMYEKFGLQDNGDGWPTTDLLNLLAAKELQIGRLGELEALEQQIRTRVTEVWKLYEATPEAKRLSPPDLLPLGVAATCFLDFAQQIELVPQFWKKGKEAMHHYVQTHEIKSSADVILGLTMLARALARRSLQTGEPLPPRPGY